MDSTTNKDISQQLAQLDRKVENKFTKMERRIVTFEKEVGEKLQPFHDYLVGQEALSKAAKGTNININPDIIKLLGLALMIIAALVGAKAIQ